MRQCPLLYCIIIEREKESSRTKCWDNVLSCSTKLIKREKENSMKGFIMRQVLQYDPYMFSHFSNNFVEVESGNEN